MARKTSALSFLPFTLTQSAADAYVQASIITALSGQTKVSYRLALFEIELPQIVVSGNSDYQVNLMRKSFAAMPVSPMLEKANIFSFRRGALFATSAGFIAPPERIMRWTWNDDDAPLIVEDPVYAQFDTALTALANVAYGRLGYWVDSISEVDRLTLIANSLS